MVFRCNRFSGQRRTVLKEKEMSKELSDDSSSQISGVVLGEYEKIDEGDTVKCTGRSTKGSPKEGAVPEEPEDETIPVTLDGVAEQVTRVAAPAKPSKGTVIGTYEAVLDGKNNERVVVKLDEGGEKEFSASKGKYSVGDRIGDK
jgi:hypothetical protein